MKTIKQNKKEYLNKIIEMRLNGATYKEIAETFGLSASSIRTLYLEEIELRSKENEDNNVS